MDTASKLNARQDSWQGPPERKDNNNKIALKWERILAMRMSTKLAKQDTAIVDSGASGWYFKPDAPVSNVNKTAATIHFGTETVQAQTSEASC